MQLDACLYQTYNTTNSNDGTNDLIETDFFSCIKTWALLTQTPFYGHPNFELPWYFGLLCYNYSIAGIFMIYIQKPKFMTNKTCYSRFFPYNTYAYLLTFLQGMCKRNYQYCYC